MSSHQIRAGKRMAPSHTTAIPAAATVVDIAQVINDVTKISLGIIHAGISSPRHGIRVRILEKAGCLLLIVRGTTSIQEVRVYSSDLQKVKLELARGIRNAGFGINFK